MQTELVRPGGAIPRPLRFARTSCALRALAVAVGFLITPSLTAHADPVDGVRVGHASWYGQEFAQRPTASGELFDPNGLTAAHRTLPLGTRLRSGSTFAFLFSLSRWRNRGPAGLFYE